MPLQLCHLVTPGGHRRGMEEGFENHRRQGVTLITRAVADSQEFRLSRRGRQLRLPFGRKRAVLKPAESSEILIISV